MEDLELDGLEARVVYKKMINAVRERVDRWYRDGLSYRDMEKATGVTHVTLYRIHNRLGYVPGYLVIDRILKADWTPKLF